MPVQIVRSGGSPLTDQQKIDFRDGIGISDEFLPTIRPTLDLDFVNGAYIDPRITFTRASTTTFYDGKTFAKAEENLLLNSATLATQNVATTAQPYTLSFEGTGTVTLSGTSTAGPLVGSTGRVSLTFTPTAGTLTLTVTGTVTNAQLEARSAATAYTPTTTQPITRYQPQLMTAPANTAVIDHDPVTGARLGLRVWEARTNLLTRSEEFDNAAWGKTGLNGTNGTGVEPVITANAGVSLNGSLTARRVTLNLNGGTSSNDRSGFFQGFSVAIGSVQTGTVFVKPLDGTTEAQLLASGIGGVFNGGTPTRTITHIGNGVYRIVSTSTSADTFCSFRVQIVGTGGINSFDGLILGAQLEAGNSASPYIPTTTAQVTRAADVASMTGANFSSWYRQDEGTLFTSMSSTGTTVGKFHGVFLFGSPETSFIGIAHESNATLARVFTNGFVSQSSLNLGSSPLSTSAALAYKTNDIAATQNGGTALTDSTAVLPSPALMRIGWNGAVGQGAGGHIRHITYYPARLSNATLQAITKP